MASLVARAAILKILPLAALTSAMGVYLWGFARFTNFFCFWMFCILGTLPQDPITGQTAYWNAVTKETVFSRPVA